MYRSLYNLVMTLLEWGIAIGAPFSEKIRHRYRGGKLVWKVLNNIDKDVRYVWFHAASLGEFEQGRPIIEAVREAFPEKKILLTFFSPSGYEVRKNYAGVDVICYLPIDRPRNARRFLSKIQIETAVFIKYEFWRNFLRQLHKRQIPVYSVSAIFRPTQLFFKSFGGSHRMMLHNIDAFFVQDEKSKKLLNTIGINSVYISGDTRFDRVTRIAMQAKKLPIISEFAKENNVLVAGSTWGKDENLLLHYFNDTPNIKLIIAPHEITKSRLEEICCHLKRPYVKYSEATSVSIAKADCLILDCFGLLSSVYQYGRAAYIGGGFGVGIHNTIEAAVWNIPVVFGPNYQKFREAVDLINCGGAYSINNEQELTEKLNEFLNDKENICGKKAGQYVSMHAGATKMIMQQIFETDKKTL